MAQSLINVLWKKAQLLLFLPYLLSLTVLLFCYKIKKARLYFKIPEIISIVGASLVVLASCIFYDCIFCPVIGSPDMNDSRWGVFVVPGLLFISCISYSWNQKNAKIKQTIAYLASLVPLLVLDFINEHTGNYAIYLSFIIPITFLYVAFKDYPIKERASYVTINALVLMVCFLGHLGFNPLKINYSEVDMHLSSPWNYTVIQKQRQYGVVDAQKGDTIVPCLFDGFKDGGFVLLLSSTGEEFKDSLLSINNIDSVVNFLHKSGYGVELNKKHGIHYVWTNLDKALYDIKQNGSSEYELEASKAYFVVRDGLSIVR